MRPKNPLKEKFEQFDFLKKEKKAEIIKRCCITEETFNNWHQGRTHIPELAKKIIAEVFLEVPEHMFPELLEITKLPKQDEFYDTKKQIKQEKKQKQAIKETITTEFKEKKKRKKTSKL